MSSPINTRSELKSEYNSIAQACDELLKDNQKDQRIVAIDILHLISEYPFFLNRYKLLCKASLSIFYLINRFSSHLIRQLAKVVASLLKRQIWIDCKDNSLDVLFVSHMLNLECDDNQLDFYYGSLPRDIMLEGMKTKILYIDHLSKKDKNSIRKCCKNLAIIPRIGPFSIEFRILVQGLSASLNLILAARSKRGGAFSRNLRAIAACDAISPTTLQSLRLRFYIMQYCALTRPHTIFVTWEGHAWERIAFEGARYINKNIKCVGYQHGVLPHSLHSALRSIGIKYDPDIIVTTGSIPAREITSRFDFPSTEVIVYGTHRRSPKASTPGSNVDLRGCIFLPQGELDECVFMTEFMINAAMCLPNIHFILRLHPLLKLCNLTDAYPHLHFPENVTVSSSKNIESDFISCAWAVYRGSATCIQAVMAGLRPLYLEKQDSSLVDPLYMLEDWRRSIKSVFELAKIISIDSLGYDNLNQWYRAREFCDQYFSEPSANAVVSALKSSN